MYWIAAEDAATTACPTTSTKFAPLQNLKDKLKQHMPAQHRLGIANTDTGYYRWWMNTANTKNSNTLSCPKFVIDLAPFFWLTVGSRGVFDLTLPLVP